MERRRESRLQVSKSVKLKVLDRMAGPSMGGAVEAEVVDVSGSGMRLRISVPVPCGAAVEIQDQRLILLGEICRCVQEPNGTYTAGLRIFEMMVASDLEDFASRRADPRQTPSPARS